MGCTASGSAAGNEGDAVSKNIDLNLRKEKKLMDSEIKLLLVGTGESGKSTIGKQMKIIYLNGFQEDERLPYRDIIIANVLMSMRSLVFAVDKFGFQVLEENTEKARRFKSQTIFFQREISPEVKDAIACLWS